MNRHAFVDESYRRNYLLCAVVVNANDVRAIRGTLVSMLRKNQRRIHMAKENRASKKVIVNRISTLPITTIMVSAAMSGRSRRSARNITLTSLTELLHEHGVTRVIIESCGQDHEDRQVIGDRLAQLSALGALDLHHLRPSEDALLWLPDIVAWVRGNPGTEWAEARRSLSITDDCNLDSAKPGRLTVRRVAGFTFQSFRKGLLDYRSWRCPRQVLPRAL